MIVFSAPFTPEGQYEEDFILNRRANIIYRIEELGESQTNVAKALRLSQSRVFQLYRQALKNRRTGLI